MATAIRPSAALMEEEQEEEASSLLSDTKALDRHDDVVEASRGYAVKNASAVKYSSEDQDGASLFAGLSFPEPPSHRPYAAPTARAPNSGPVMTTNVLPTRTVPFDASKVFARIMINLLIGISSHIFCYSRFKPFPRPLQSARCHMPPRQRRSLECLILSRKLHMLVVGGVLLRQSLFRLHRCVLWSLQEVPKHPLRHSSTSRRRIS